MINIFRKKTKCTSLVALLAAILMICTGCVRSGVGVVINEDNTGTVEVSVGINEKYIDAIKEQAGDVELFSGQNTATLTEGEDNYICTVDHRDFTNLEELKTILMELEYDFSSLEGESSGLDESEVDDSFDFEWDFDSDEEEDEDIWISADGEEIIPEAEETENYHIFKNVDVTHTANFLGDTYRLSLTTMPHEMDTDDLAMFGISTDDMFKLVVAITMPGAMKAEGAEINENTASFTISDLDEENVLVAESSTTNVTGMIAVGIAVVVLIVILILVFNRKKNQKNYVFN